MHPFRWPWFPYVFALGLPLTVYSHNQAAFPLGELARPLAAFLLATAVLLLVVRRLVACQVLAGLLVAAALIGLWHFGFGRPFVVLVGLLIVAGVVLRRRRIPTGVVPVLNALAVGVLLLPVITILQVERLTRAPEWGIEYSPFTGMSDAKMTGQKPDIYHIVLDAYGGADALSGVLGFDNSDFFGSLRQQGFVVNESSISPYNETVHIMSSMFLGEYLRAGEFPIDSENSTVLRAVLGTLIVNGPVHDMLRANGYRVLYTDPGHDFLRFPRDAVVLRALNSGPFNRFESYLGSLVGLEPLLPTVYELSQERPLIRSVKTAFSQDFSDFESPKFVYEHVIAPHTPFVIDRNGVPTAEYPQFTDTSEGDSVVRSAALRQQYIEGYLEKLRYVNDRVLQQVERLREVGGNKIIILHGDHGSGAYYFMNDPDNSCLRERYTTFLAVYADDPTIREQFGWVTAPDATLVNVYRTIYNSLLDTDLEMRPAMSAFVPKAFPHVVEPLDRARIQAPCAAAQPRSEVYSASGDLRQ